MSQPVKAIFKELFVKLHPSRLTKDYSPTAEQLADNTESMNRLQNLITRLHHLEKFIHVHHSSRPSEWLDHLPPPNLCLPERTEIVFHFPDPDSDSGKLVTQKKSFTFVLDEKDDMKRAEQILFQPLLASMGCFDILAHIEYGPKISPSQTLAFQFSPLEGDPNASNVQLSRNDLYQSIQSDKTFQKRLKVLRRAKYQNKTVPYAATTASMVDNPNRGIGGMHPYKKLPQKGLPSPGDGRTSHPLDTPLSRKQAMMSPMDQMRYKFQESMKHLSAHIPPNLSRPEATRLFLLGKSGGTELGAPAPVSKKQKIRWSFQSHVESGLLFFDPRISIDIHQNIYSNLSNIAKHLSPQKWLNKPVPLFIAPPNASYSVSQGPEGMIQIPSNFDIQQASWFFAGKLGLHFDPKELTKAQTDVVHEYARALKAHQNSNKARGKDEAPPKKKRVNIRHLSSYEKGNPIEYVLELQKKLKKRYSLVDRLTIYLREKSMDPKLPPIFKHLPAESKIFKLATEVISSNSNSSENSNETPFGNVFEEKDLEVGIDVGVRSPFSDIAFDDDISFPVSVDEANHILYNLNNDRVRSALKSLLKSLLVDKCLISFVHDQTHAELITNLGADYISNFIDDQDEANFAAKHGTDQLIKSNLFYTSQSNRSHQNPEEDDQDAVPELPKYCIHLKIPAGITKTSLLEFFETSDSTPSSSEFQKNQPLLEAAKSAVANSSI